STSSAASPPRALHAALPIWRASGGNLVRRTIDRAPAGREPFGPARVSRTGPARFPRRSGACPQEAPGNRGFRLSGPRGGSGLLRSEEHTSELQSRENLVCRL